MFRPQPSSTFAVLSQPVPAQPVSGAAAAPSAVRMPKPFTLVTSPDEREMLEPHWHPAIDAATD